MMKLRIRFLLVACLGLVAPGWSADGKDYPKYGPKDHPIAVPMSQSHEYLCNPQNAAPDFWLLMPYYVAQFNGGACSVATVSMIVNGFIRAGRGYELHDRDTNISQMDLVQNENQHQWKGKITAEGFKGRLALKLASLNNALKENLISFGMPEVKTIMVQTKENTPEALTDFRRTLEENERSGTDFVIIHFCQGMLTQSPEGLFPHISPIGAYDKENRRVLILDVDRKWYEPYWVPDTMLFEAMVNKTKAFGHGGYIRVWKPEVSEQKAEDRGQ